MLVQTIPGFPNGPFVAIPLNNGMVALVDPGWFDILIGLRWYAKKSFKCWYACRKIEIFKRAYIVRMHRIIANTPTGMICHHINHDSLDNRFHNLRNMTLFDHTKLHSYR